MKTVILDVRLPTEAETDFALAWRTGKSSKTAHISFVDFTRFSRQTSTSGLKLFEVHRAQLVEMAVPADAIVEALDVVKHV